MMIQFKAILWTTYKNGWMQSIEHNFHETPNMYPNLNANASNN